MKYPLAWPVAPPHPHVKDMPYLGLTIDEMWESMCNEELIFDWIVEEPEYSYYRDET